LPEKNFAWLAGYDLLATICIYDPRLRSATAICLL